MNQTSEVQGDGAVLTVFMLVKTMPEWLGLASTQRFSELKKHLEPVVVKYKDSVTLRFYDVEFYSARVTDVWMWEAVSHHAYELLVEELRETPFWDRYFSDRGDLPGAENAYAKNYERDGLAA